MPPPTPQPNPPQQPTGQLLNTQPAPQMPPDKNAVSLVSPPNANGAMTNLGFANTMFHHLLQYKGKQNSKVSPEPQKPPLSEEKSEPKDTPQEDAQEPNTAEFDQKIANLQASHDKEIMMLKHELEVQGIKQSNDKKVTELETKHQKEIEDLKNTVKTIISG